MLVVRTQHTLFFIERPQREVLSEAKKRGKNEEDRHLTDDVVKLFLDNYTNTGTNISRYVYKIPQLERTTLQKRAKAHTHTYIHDEHF